MTSSLIDAPSELLSGAQRPRVSFVPPYLSSAGEDTVELCAENGVIYDDWQAWTLAGAMGERDDGRWAAGTVGLSVPRQNGKGEIIMGRELGGLFIVREEIIVHTAHVFRTSGEAFRRILAVIERSEDLSRKVKRVSKSHGEEEIELRPEPRIITSPGRPAGVPYSPRLVFAARSTGGGRGLFGDCIILDEAFALAQAHMDALLPLLASIDNPQVWYTSSPALDAVTGEIWMGIRKRGEKATPGMFWADWGCETGADLDDRGNWAQANPALGGRMRLETVEEFRRSMTPDGFGREILGIWPETAGDAVISPELWASLAADVERPADPVFAIDVSPDRRSASILAVGGLEDGRHLLSVVEKAEGTDWLVDRVKVLRDRWQPLLFVLDALSPAATFIPKLAEIGVVEADRDKPQRGQLVVMNTRDAAVAWGMFVDRARQRGLAHLDEVPLNVALSSAKVRPLGDGSAWARRGGGDITPLVAATEGSWALQMFADVVRTESEPGAYWL